MSNIICIVPECLIQGIFHFLVSKTKIHNIIKPLMQHKELIIITEILKNKKPKTCLEWGAGNSTIYFPQYLDEDAKWIAIEHDKEWFNECRRRIRYDGKVKIYYMPPNEFPWTDDHGDGSFSDLEDYITFPEKLDEKFDFILIDGRARKNCLINALKLLNIDGIVVLHDANRKYYHEPFRLYKYGVLFKDFGHDAGGIWIGSKTLGFAKFFDINKHKLNWKILENLQKPIWRIICLLTEGK